MKKINVFFCLAVLALASCKNDLIKPAALTSFNVTNVVVSGNTLNINNSNLSVPANYFSQISLVAGESKLDLFDSSITPNVIYYNQTINTTTGSYYSLFLTGGSPTAVESVLIKENYKNYTDSVCAVRFINLSAGSNPVSVDITGNANGSEVSSLAYKAYSSFKQYPAKAANANYNFEVRDAATTTLIASYTLTTPYFHNVTLALTGAPGTQGILQINEY